jgi:hypothetical protein
MWASPDRWTCPVPTCGKTVVIDGSDEDTAAAIAACQQRHYKAHRDAAVLDAKLRKTDVRNPAPRWGRAS